MAMIEVRPHRNGLDSRTRNYLHGCSNAAVHRAERVPQGRGYKIDEMDYKPTLAWRPRFFNRVLTRRASHYRPSFR